METIEKQEIEEKIKNLIDLRIKPLLQQDGGDIVFHSMDENGDVEIELIGACCGCPNAKHTVKDVIENTLKYFIPEVNSVRNIEAND